MKSLDSIKNNFSPDEDYVSNEEFPQWAQEKDLLPGNIYYAKKDFIVDGIRGEKNQPRQFIGISDQYPDKVAFSLDGKIIYLDKSQFEENFPKSSVSTKGLKHVALSTVWPLMSRVAASKNPKLSNFKDRGSKEILDALHQDNDYDSFNVQFNKQDELFTAARTEIFDEKIKDFVKKYPDCIIVNIGGGLDPNIGPDMFDDEESKKNVKFYNIDLPEVNAIQKKILKQSENQILIGKSVFDFGWINEIPQNKKILFVVEGVFMYFTKDQVKNILLNIADNFPGSEMVFEVPSKIVKNLSRFDVDLRSTNTPFQFGIKSGKEIEKWDKKGRIEFVNDTPYIEKYTDQWGLLGKLSNKPIVGKIIKGMKKNIHLKFK